MGDDPGGAGDVDNTTDASDAGDESAAATRSDAGAPTCPQCGDPLYRRHCKYVCPNHGVVMDCADTFWN